MTIAIKFPTLLLMTIFGKILANTNSSLENENVSCRGEDCDEIYVINNPLSRLMTRADDNGADNLFAMVRDLICKEYYPTKSLRKCSVKDHQIESVLRNYGCNCLPENFDGEPGQVGGHPSWNMGKNGKPINDIDRACVILRDQYTCLVKDVEEDLYPHIDENSPNNEKKCGRLTQYTFHTTPEKEIKCGPNSNPDYVNGYANAGQECQFMVCQMERRFAESVFELIGSDPENFYTENSEFYFISEDEAVCVENGARGRQSECCGEYPDRLPFNPIISECCEDGSSALVGSCL